MDTQSVINLIGGLLVTMEPDGTIANLKADTHTLIGCATDEFPGRKWFDVFTSIDPKVPCRTYFLEVVATAERSRYVNQFTTRDGRTFFFEWHFTCQRDPSGALRQVMGFGQDISTRMDNEGKLLQAHYRLVKKNRELSCLYGIIQISSDAERSFNEKLQAITEHLLTAFQYPDLASAQIILDGESYQTPGFESAPDRLCEDVVVEDKVHGRVSVGYRKQAGVSSEENTVVWADQQSLLKVVARQLAFILKKQELKAQVKHADRLATIGQLAAGIAHELNNPLGDILGFAQLASSRTDIPEETYEDLVKIVKSALYAREVIKKILLFSRQSLPRETKADLNALIRDWLDFITFRCAKNNIEVVLDLDDTLPQISGDPAQLNQALVNLIINAIHAMADGGRLTIKTCCKDDGISVVVEDTGTGIPDAILDQIFLPFFTTKEVDQGTGLGLSVVYGIVKEHGGTVSVRTRERQGSAFELFLPFKRPKPENAT